MKMSRKKWVFAAVFAGVCVIYANFTVPAAGEDREVRFSLAGVPGDYLDDPLLVRGMILAGGFTPEDEDDYESAATYLSMAKTPEIAQMLMDAGADVNAHTQHGGTVLFGVRDARMAQFFVDAGTDVNRCDNDGYTALMYSCGAAVTRVLLDAGAVVNPDELLLSWQADELPLHFAPDAESARMLLAAGADVNARSGSGATPLLLAVDEVHLGHGLDYDEGTPPQRPWNAHFWWMDMQYDPDDLEADADGMFRETRERIAKTRVLIEAGADVNVEHESGYTPLMLARTPGVVKLLLDAGAKADAEIRGGITPLHVAGMPGSVRLLLAAGADVHAVTEDGRTPLFGKGCPECIRLLLDAVADPEMQDDAGRTPYYYTYGEQTRELLIQAGATLGPVEGDDDDEGFEGFSDEDENGHWGNGRGFRGFLIAATTRRYFTFRSGGARAREGP